MAATPHMGLLNRPAGSVAKAFAAAAIPGTVIVGLA
jgi:hypothetical protein